MTEKSYRGALFIGDPHLSSRTPGFRKDDYPQTILSKLRFTLNYAEEHNLLPVLLGDLFHFPRDNANWLLTEAMYLLARRGVLAICGNHDCSEDALVPDDSLSVLAAAGVVRLLDDCPPQRFDMNGVCVRIGGTSWGKSIPASVDRENGEQVVFWITHHDILFGGYENLGRLRTREVPGVDLIINGHIHRTLEPVVKGCTTWFNMGNITRVSRGDASRDRLPAALRIDVHPDGTWSHQLVPVDHRPFDEVFHAEVASDEVIPMESAFVRGLEKLTNLKTEGGAGLLAFLDENLHQFDPRVAAEIRSLAKEICPDANT
jgi:hypothetical protein